MERIEDEARYQSRIENAQLCLPIVWWVVVAVAAPCTGTSAPGYCANVSPPAMLVVAGYALTSLCVSSISRNVVRYAHFLRRRDSPRAPLLPV